MLAELQGLYPTHACREFLQAWPALSLSERAVPQLEPLSAKLRYLRN